MNQTEAVSGRVGRLTVPAHPVPSHLASVQPVLQPVAPADAWQCQVVEDVLPQRAEQGTTQAQAEQHKETREVVDAHLQGLQRVEYRHKTFKVMADPWGALAWRTEVGPETGIWGNAVGLGG